MQLKKENIGLISARSGLEIPDKDLFDMPEKVLQFGTGVLLRALPDYFIDKANKQGIFNGRVVVVKSTDSDSSGYDRQDGLYTVCVRGVENGKSIEEDIINASVSRVLAAKTEWDKILACAHNPDLGIIISNTTEVGIRLENDDITAAPPLSFPGKLLAFLFERYKAFDGSADAGMLVIPTELISDNGSKLESIVLELAHRHDLDYPFIEWLENHNIFCNSLVDRIVPGKPGPDQLTGIESALGYHDELLTMAEAFRLWAIEGNEKVKSVLSFSRIDDGMIITPDITLFKELKLRLLNGTHTFNCGTAFLCGFNITRDAMADPVYGEFTRTLMHKEIAPSIPVEIEENTKTDFANRVFERFCNPFIDHRWQSITVQYTSKMKMRNVPLLQKYFREKKTIPLHMACAFSAYLLYMKSVRMEDNRYYGSRNGEFYEIKDDAAAQFYQLWKDYPAAQVAEKVMQNKKLWETDLTALPGFRNMVSDLLNDMIKSGVMETIKTLSTKKVMV